MDIAEGRAVIVVALNGKVDVMAGGRDETIDAEWALIALRESTVILPPGGGTVALIETSLCALLARFPDLRAYPCLRFSTASLAGGLFAVMIRYLCDRLDSGSGQQLDAPIARHVLELLATALGEDFGADRGNDERSRRRLRIRAFVDANLGDPELSPGRIAEHFMISARTLYQLFNQESEAIGHWIIQRRLERSYDALCDPSRGHVPVADIASELGFRSAAHFSRRFRERYGVPPGRLRRELPEEKRADERRGQDDQAS